MFQKVLSALILIFVQTSAANAGEEMKELETAEEYIVPKDKIWTIDNFTPWSAPQGVGTANFSFDGSISVNDDQIVLDGKFDVTIGKDVKRITVYPGTKLQVLDSQGTASVRETDEPQTK